MERGLQVDVIYFDFQKAFDKIDNDLLLHKLSDIGFTSGLLEFFSDYMRDRLQYVRHGTYESRPYHTRSGVSQGSVLGPLLFLIMIRDLPKVLTAARCLLYADDLKLFMEIKSPSDCLSLQNDIDLIHKWSLTNKMKFNMSKCNIMTFYRKKKPIYFNYYLQGLCINRMNCMKDLGVTFDRTLTFHDHIASLAKETYRRLGFVLRNAKDFQNPKIITTLYNALVRSKLEHSACVWNPHHVTYTRMLEKVQKTFLRFLYKKVYGYYPFMYPTKFLLGHLGFNSLEVRRMVDQLTTCLKVLRGAVDCLNLHNLLCVIFIPNECEIPVNRRGHCRHNNLFHPDTGHTTARAMSPLVRPLLHLNALRDANTEFDISFDKWPTIVSAVLTYCESMRDQWVNTGNPANSDDE